MMGNYFGGGYGFGGYGLGFILMILFWGLIIWAIVAAIRGCGGHGGSCGGSSKGDDAEALLRVRYAKGEITKEQFDQMKKDLNR